MSVRLQFHIAVSQELLYFLLFVFGNAKQSHCRPYIKLYNIVISLERDIRVHIYQVRPLQSYIPIA